MLGRCLFGVDRFIADAIIDDETVRKWVGFTERCDGT
jgi:hypothetical protein